MCWKVSICLALLIAQIIDRVLVDLRPLLWNDIEKIILYITLNYNLVVMAGHRRSARELCAEELCCYFEIDA